MPKREHRLYLTQYATDLTDAQWAAIAPLVTVTSPKGGRPTSKYMTRCVNWRDKRWLATQSRQSASWTPHQSRRPKQAGIAASTEKSKRTQTLVLG
jgi:putative transposase